MRLPEPKSKELRAAIRRLNLENAKADVVSVKPGAILRMENHKARRELKHDAMMTNKQRSIAERLRQQRLTVQRAAQRIGAILKGLPSTERTTEMGIVLPSGPQIGELLTRAAKSSSVVSAKRT